MCQPHKICPFVGFWELTISDLDPKVAFPQYVRGFSESFHTYKGKVIPLEAQCGPEGG